MIGHKMQCWNGKIWVSIKIGITLEEHDAPEQSNGMLMMMIVCLMWIDYQLVDVS